MGITASTWWNGYIASPKTRPDIKGHATFDPMYGFPEGRKQRDMIATEEQMQLAGLATEDRDYCAHYLIDFYKCRRENFPYVASCKLQKHLFDDCQFRDFVLRMKEYERERRLKDRARRKKLREDRIKVLEIMANQ